MDIYEDAAYYDLLYRKGIYFISYRMRHKQLVHVDQHRGYHEAYSKQLMENRITPRDTALIRELNPKLKNFNKIVWSQN